MPKMTAKYSKALIAYRQTPQGLNRLDDQDSLYAYLQGEGHFWDSETKRWDYHEPADADAPTPLIMLRVWADGEILEEAVNDLVDLIKRSKLPWTLLERSTPYGCRPPKQREGRIYLKFLPRGKIKFTNMITGETREPEPWQLELTIGDYYFAQSPQGMIGDDTFQGPNIYGRIVSSEDCQPGYFYVRAYSQWCPEGELGLFNICEPTRRLTQAEFDQARENGWP